MRAAKAPARAGLSGPYVEPPQGDEERAKAEELTVHVRPTWTRAPGVPVPTRDGLAGPKAVPTG